LVSQPVGIVTQQQSSECLRGVLCMGDVKVGASRCGKTNDT
jgi:hypothetical protein